MPAAPPSSTAEAPLGRRSGAAIPDLPPARPSARPPGVRTLRRALARVSAMDRAVLRLYLLTRVGMWAVAYCTGWLFTGDGRSTEAPSVLSRWQQWDWAHFQRIAQDGYFPGPGLVGGDRPDNREAFFPGFPLLLRAVHLVVADWAAAGLLISFAAGAVAVSALARIARLDTGDQRAGGRAVLFLLLSPCEVFLAAGYTEALFLALALPCWLAARRGNWPLAAVLACLATGVRISGLFLAAALVVQFLACGREQRRWSRLPWLALPALPALLYSWYLHARTGDWMAWKHAQERGWYREFHAPWVAWRNTWHGAFSHDQSTTYALLFQAELLAMAVGVLLLCVLLRRRRWAEAAYVGLSLWALGTSYWYMSIPRASLLWWPLWVLLARWSLRRPWLKDAYLGIAAPLMTVLAIAFTSGRWAG
ncbi:mannosyltransferase family protein [Streptomyces sp. NPDC092296]|uniref:mannosyltransferase family protein n=1 Tax=Streptomyces sp. NPDC092296 TaxID=3366012 RepID=UPI00381EA47B